MTRTAVSDDNKRNQPSFVNGWYKLGSIDLSFQKKKRHLRRARVCEVTLAQLVAGSGTNLKIYQNSRDHSSKG